MHVIKDRNVNRLFPRGLRLAIDRGVKSSPRGFETLEVPVPVASVYECPTERILFSPIRDANPFFHLMEALWILGGRHDVRFISQFNSNIASYSDDGKIFHGAYGYRLRQLYGDQLWKAITKFKQEPNTRQVVLQIWDADHDLGVYSKDIPCNDLIMLKIRQNKLHMTVCNRSNDIVWGCYGANAVQFSIIQEYLAACIGVEVGTYTQVSDSFHIYTNVPKFDEYKTFNPNRTIDPYERNLQTYPLVQCPATFDQDLFHFLEGVNTPSKNNPFFNNVAWLMFDAWHAHKEGKEGAQHAAHIAADDWRLACLLWLERRQDSIPREYWGFTDDQLRSYNLA